MHGGFPFSLLRLKYNTKLYWDANSHLFLWSLKSQFVVFVFNPWVKNFHQNTVWTKPNFSNRSIKLQQEAKYHLKILQTEHKMPIFKQTNLVRKHVWNRIRTKMNGDAVCCSLLLPKFQNQILFKQLVCSFSNLQVLGNFQMFYFCLWFPVLCRLGLSRKWIGHGCWGRRSWNR